MPQNDSKKLNIPQAVISRLPRYYRFLGELLRDDIFRINSAELAKMMGVTASQLRQDLSRFGEFGLRGYGYNVKYLYDRISEILGITNNYRAVIVGAGDSGNAIAANPVFMKRSIRLCGVFDSGDRVGMTVAGHTVADISGLFDFCSANEVDILVITLPKNDAAALAPIISELPIKGVWNFSGAELNLKPDIPVQNVDIEDTLMMLCHKIVSSDQYR